MAVKSTSGRIALLDAATGELIKDFKNQKEGEGSPVWFSPSGNQLVDGSWDGLIRVRNTATGDVVFERHFENEMVSSIFRAARANVWISLHSPKSIKDDETPPSDYFLIWNWPFTESKPVRIDADCPFVSDAAISPCGKLLTFVYGAPPVSMLTIELDSRNIVWSEKVQGKGSLKWSPCGKFLAAVEHQRVAVYESSSGTLLKIHESSHPSSIDFSCDTSLIAFGDWQDGKIERFKD